MIETIWTIAKALCLVLVVGTGCFFVGSLSLALYKYIVE